MLDANDLAKTYYSAARAEIVQRLALREQVLLAGAAGIASAYGKIAELVEKSQSGNG